MTVVGNSAGNSRTGRGLSAGIRNAQAKGTKFGRPLRAVDPDRILQMRGEGQSLRQIAENLGVGYGTFRERLKDGKRKTPRKTDREKPDSGHLGPSVLPGGKL